LPFHPYTQASSTPVTPGALTRYDVEVFPTYATVKPGHALRVTISTADVPHLAPTQPAAANLAGGVYTLERTPTAASAIEVPLVP
jgi:predicted acyl esterase